jgi:hypothetical protein
MFLFIISIFCLPLECWELRPPHLPWCPVDEFPQTESAHHSSSHDCTEPDTWIESQQFHLFVWCAIVWYVCVQIPHAKQSSGSHAVMKVYMLPHITLHIVDDLWRSLVASPPANNHIVEFHLIPPRVPHHVPIFCDLYESLQLLDVGCSCVNMQCLALQFNEWGHIFWP